MATEDGHKYTKSFAVESPYWAKRAERLEAKADKESGCFGSEDEIADAEFQALYG